jgi:hypothetical protein
MNATPFGTPGPREPAIERTFLTTGDQLDSVTTQELQFDTIWCSYGTILDREELRWQKNDETNPAHFYTVIGRTVFVGSGPDQQWLGVSIAGFELGQGTDPRSKAPIEVRKKVIKRTFGGEPIFDLIRLDAVRLFTEYHPDERQLSHSEFKSYVAGLAPVIERDRALSQSDRASTAARVARASEAAAARENPQQYLAAAIAQGVAAALANMKGGK